MPFRVLFLLLSIITFCFSCTKESNTVEGDIAYLGGEIINPTTNYIVLFKSRKILDTVYLNPENRFSYKFQNIESGIYSFNDGKESQFFILQPNDSIMFRLNTIEFDESLQFTGKGAKENNYLLNLFLQNERHEKAILSLSQLSPNEFDTRLTEITNSKHTKLNSFIERNKPTELFKKIAKATIDYNHYYSKEFYPFAHYSKSESSVFKDLPENFYDYRKNINFNDTLVKDYFPYTSFLRLHFSNSSLEKHFAESSDIEYDPRCLNYNLHKLKLINQNVSNDYIKNDLLYNSVIKLINHSKNLEDYDAVFNSFDSVSTNKKHRKTVSKFVSNYKRIHPGKSLPDVYIIGKDDNKQSIKKLIKNKPTVIYFWSLKNRYHLKDVHERVYKLKTKYPEVNFVALNTDHISSREQADILKRKGLKLENQYRFEEPDKACDLLSIRPITNVFLVNNKAKIVDPKANMFTIEFEKELLALLNQ